MQNLLGLIGYPLSHSFSKKYFADKFEKEGIKGWNYELFPIEDIEFLNGLVQEYTELRGLNVTIPYKEQVIPYLDELDEAAAAIGAVNTIRFEHGKLIGFNTDAYGFEKSLLEFLSGSTNEQQIILNNEEKTSLVTNRKALVFGTGGAAKAVKFVLEDLGIAYLVVSRRKGKADLTYDELTADHVQSHSLIINTTPLGMSPHVNTCPAIPYEALTNENFLYDLVYNPEKTLFLKRGLERGASILNGYNMLVYQAEKAWEIWTT